MPASKKEITIGKFYMVILPIFKKIEQDAVDLKETRKQGKKEEGEKMYDQLKQSVHRESIGIPEPAAGSANSAIISVVDERVKHFLQLEMKKVSQMLIQNLTVFV